MMVNFLFSMPRGHGRQGAMKQVCYELRLRLGRRKTAKKYHKPSATTRTPTPPLMTGCEITLRSAASATCGLPSIDDGEIAAASELFDVGEELGELAERSFALELAAAEVGAAETSGVLGDAGVSFGASLTSLASKSYTKLLGAKDPRTTMTPVEGRISKPVRGWTA
ncbi:hypothetical protein [Arthrobacter sp. JSM 101049]|uniref:hypothetical protein n=1 Tax=Arthrobacter sp. JSM 101049 TaxID=929097 RepID=UPI00356364B4